jgi:hypothetical protein
MSFEEKYVLLLISSLGTAIFTSFIFICIYYTFIASPHEWWTNKAFFVINVAMVGINFGSFIYKVLSNPMHIL